MATSINTFQDILDALEREPKLREDLRRHLLTDDLIDLPARFTKFVELQTEHNSKMDHRLEILENGMAVVNRRLEILENDMGQVKSDIGVLKEDMAQVKTDLARIEGTVIRIEDAVARMGGDVSRLDGKDYEATAAGFAHRLVRRHMGLLSPRMVSRAKGSDYTPPLTFGDEAAEQGHIQWNEADDLVKADVIISATTPDGEEVFVLGEISITVQQKDSDTAIRRADILQRATGIRTIPVTIGQRLEMQDVDYPIFLMHNGD